MPGTPQQNDVVERRNYIIMNMVRSMLSHSSLTLFLWMHALKIVMYILNRLLVKQSQKHILRYG